jgi:short-subunit dehydrogenase
LASNYRVEVATLVADLERPSDVSDLEARIAADDVTFVVNNAGAGGLARIADITADQLERVIQLNITALTRLSHAALTGFRKREAGVLVNIGSMMAHSASASAAAYSGSKAYVLNFTRSLQMEFAGSPIRIQLVMPGPIRTEFFSSQGLASRSSHRSHISRPKSLWMQRSRAWIQVNLSLFRRCLMNSLGPHWRRRALNSSRP